MISELRHSHSFIATSAAVLAVATAACHPEKHRYVRVPVPPGEALSRVAEDAHRAGWRQLGGSDVYLVYAPGPPAASRQTDAASDEELSKEEKAEANLRSWGALYVKARAFHADGGSLVELTPQRSKVFSTGTHPLTRSSLETPFAGSPDVWFTSADRLRSRAVWDVNVASGIAVDSRFAAFRIDVATQLGYRFRERGGTGSEPSPRRGLAGTLGIGFAAEHHGMSLRPSLSLWIDSQRTVQLAPGAVIPQSRKRAIELSVAPIIGMGTSRSGAEAGVAAHVWPWGAVFARVGYDWEPRKQRTYFFGAQTDALTSGYVLLGLLAIAAGIGLANADYSGILDGWCHAGECEYQ